MNTSNELTALQNFENSLNEKYDCDIKVKYFFNQDKRKKTKFILTSQDTFISPPLNYDNMNHFLLGVNSCKKNQL